MSAVHSFSLTVTVEHQLLFTYKHTPPSCCLPVSVQTKGWWKAGGKAVNAVCVETVQTYRYLGLELDDSLYWSHNIDTLYKKGQSRLYLLRRLGSFNVCQKLLQMFYQTVISSVLSPRCGVLGRQHQEEGRHTAGQTGEEGRISGWCWTGLTDICSWEKDPQQDVVHHGQCPPPSAPDHHQAEELFQWQAAVPVLLHWQTQEVICSSGCQALQLLSGQDLSHNSNNPTTAYESLRHLHILLCTTLYVHYCCCLTPLYSIAVYHCLHSTIIS